MGTIKVLAGTELLDRFSKPLTSFSVQKVTSLPQSPDGKTIISAYEFGPAGARFNPYITIKLKYDSSVLPFNANPENLQVAFWNGTEWEFLNTTMNKVAGTLSFNTNHFSLYAIVYPEVSDITTMTTQMPSVITTSESVPTTESVSSTTIEPTLDTLTETTIPAPVEETDSLTPIVSAATTTAGLTTSSNTSEVPEFRLDILASAVGIAMLLIVVTTTVILVGRFRLLRKR
jgi:hypothetical protein